MTTAARASCGSKLALSLMLVLAGCVSAHAPTVQARTPLSRTLRSRTLRATSAAPTVAGFVPVARSEAASATAATCTSAGAGFQLSLVEGLRGAPDPRAAAQVFSRRGGVSGFGTSSSTWVIVHADHRGAGEVTLLDGTVSLDALRLGNGTWAITGGTRCG